ncbi:MAG: hypothetical protein ACKO37_01905 [Vampirovibrionales bacterium]
MTFDSSPPTPGSIHVFKPSYRRIGKGHHRIKATYLTYDPILERLVHQLLQTPFVFPQQKHSLHIILNMLKVVAEHQTEDYARFQCTLMSPLRRQQHMRAWHGVNRALQQALSVLQTCPETIQPEVYHTVITHLRVTLSHSA